MVAMEDEQRLITRSCNGDHEAFEALIRAYQRMIHALCYRMTGSLADAEDLAQETFVHAYQHLSQFRSEARFSSWLYRIAVNQSLNLRQRKARALRLQEEWGQQAHDTGSQENSQSRQIQEALIKLPPKQRAAVVLTTFDGLSHAEAARVLGCSEATVS